MTKKEEAIKMAILMRNLYWKGQRVVGGIQELIDPTPILISEGRFKKPRVVKYVPFCKDFVDYTGDKEPINDVPLRLW